jgi:hypothetical protein
MPSIFWKGGVIDKVKLPPKKYREPPPPIATFGQLLCRNPKWFWIHCNNRACRHKAALPLAPFAIRWGMDAPAVPTIRQAFRCSQCGDKTSTITAPGIGLGNEGFQAFPACTASMLFPTMLGLAEESVPAETIEVNLAQCMTKDSR